MKFIYIKKKKKWLDFQSTSGSSRICLFSLKLYLFILFSSTFFFLSLEQYPNLKSIITYLFIIKFCTNYYFCFCFNHLKIRISFIIFWHVSKNKAIKTIKERRYMNNFVLLPVLSGLIIKNQSVQRQYIYIDCTTTIHNITDKNK